MSSLSDEALAGFVIKGERAAWEELYDRYFDVLFRFCFGYLKSEAIAEDVVQEVFEMLPKSLQKYNRERRFRTWIFTLAANRSKNVLRNHENRNRINNKLTSEKLTTEDAVKHMDAKVLRSEVQLIISKCNDKEKELYHLRFEMDLSINEISETMNIPVGSVKSGLFYLLAKLSKPLKKISDEYR
jgi:RNA polymerase sigma-70 factor (ECF subfamily)